MTLDDAIRRERHAMRQSFGERSAEHRQLAEWLRELRDIKAENKKLKALVRDMWHDGMCDCDELVAAQGQCHCAKCEYGYSERMRELGIEVD